MPGVGRDTQRHSMSPHNVAGGPAGAFELRYLEILHRVECIHEPAFFRIDIQAARLQGKQELMRRLDGGKAPGGGWRLIR